MIIDDINLSIKIILRNKFRTFIAIIGIVTGVSLLIVTFSLLKIGEMKILSNIDKIGKNIIKINKELQVLEKELEKSLEELGL